MPCGTGEAPCRDGARSSATTRSATPRAVVYLAPMTVRAPSAPSALVIEHLRGHQQVSTAVASSHRRHEAAVDEGNVLPCELESGERVIGMRR